MKGISLKIRLPKKVLLGLLGLVLVGGAGGGFAVYAGYIPLGAQEEAHDDAAAVAGVACTTLDMIKLQRNGQRWLRKVVTTEGADGLERVRTALRVAGVLAKGEKADLYQVVVLDHAGPTTRAERRGPAIGAEVLFAPSPDRLPEMSAPFEARYINADANAAGLFFGEEVVLSPEDVRKALTAMTDRSDCADPHDAVAAAAAAEGHGAPKDGHGKPAEGHGEAAAEGHGEAPAEGHGAAPAEGHGAEPAAEGGHGAASADGEAGHGAVAETAAKGGFFSSVLSMIPGMGADAPAEGHGAAETAEADPSGGHDAPAEKGLLSSLIDMVPFVGGGEDTATAEGHDGPAAAESHEAEAKGHDAPAEAKGHDAPAAAEGHEAPVEATVHETVPAEPAHGDAVASEAAHEGQAATDAHGVAPAAAEKHAPPVHAVPPASQSGHAEATAEPAHDPAAHEAVTVKSDAPETADHATEDHAAETAPPAQTDKAHTPHPPTIDDKSTAATH